MRLHATARIFALSLCMAAGGCGAEDHPAPRESRLRVTCTTTMLSAVVGAVGGDKVDVHTIVPFGMCPGHFDLTPGEADKLRNADVILFHGFERFMAGKKPGSNTEMVKAGVKGNWMVPAIHTQAVARVRDVLAEAMPASGGYFAKRAEAYSRAVAEKAEQFRERLAAIRGTPVVSAEMNRSLAEWLGLRVVAEFARDEGASVKALHEILNRAKSLRAVLVIDNRQSSGKIGRTIADDLGVPFAILSNFPIIGFGPGDRPAYLAALSDNCAAVLEALDAKAKDE
ncbi:MAG: metal ABC transporter substrate-binding protein [Kiritimatiellia bacterium]